VAANAHPGLCATCIHAKTIQNDRGSVFWLCEAHKTRPDLPRYPRLPVVRCPVYAPHNPTTTPADQTNTTGQTN